MAFSFQFTVQADYETTNNAVHAAIKKVGQDYKERPGGGCSFRVTGLKFFLYLSESDGITTLRFLNEANSGKKEVMQAYDRFLIALDETGLNIPVIPGKPYIVTTIPIGGGIEQKFTSKQNFSMGGAVMGGLLFGDLGAVIGGYSGTRRGQTRSFLSNSAFFLICYSNGWIEEKEVRKNSPLYAEVMAKLNATPVIHKDALDSKRMKYIDELSKKKSFYDLPLWVRMLLAFILAFCILYPLYKAGFFPHLK